MKYFWIIPSLLFLLFWSNSNAQDFQIRNVDESDYPSIKVNLKFQGNLRIDFSKLHIIEAGDTLKYKVDSIVDTENNKAICILISEELLKDKSLIENTLKSINDMVLLLSEGDELNVIIAGEEKTNTVCIKPISYEFTHDFAGLTDFFQSHLSEYSYSDKSTMNACSIEKSIEFISKKGNLPSKKLLLILTTTDNNIDTLSVIRKKAMEQNITIHSINLLKELSTQKFNKETRQQFINELFDSLFSEKYITTYSDKKIYEFKFHTNQKAELNQFEIEYKGRNQRSTFAKPGYMGFFRENMFLLGTIAFFLLLIIFFIINLIYTKRQIMLSPHEYKGTPANKILFEDTGLDNFNPRKTFIANTSIVPFITVEIEGKNFSYELSKLVTKIGRHQENDIVIDNLTISSTHATITNEDGQFYIQDNLSTNGTFVNDIKISKVPIKNGDVIRLGKARIFVTC